MAAATSKQVRTVWSFCAKYCSDGHSSELWAKLGRTEVLSKSVASALIGKIVSFKETPSAEKKAALEVMLGAFVPGIKIVANPYPNGPKDPGKGEEEGKDEKEGGGGGGPGYNPDIDGPNGKAPEGGEMIEGEGGEGGEGDKKADPVAELLRQLQEELKKKIEPQKTPVPQVPQQFDVSPDYVVPPEFEKIYRHAKAGINPLLTGGAGMGKSRLTKELAKALHLPNFFNISFGGSLRYPQVFGSTKLTVDEHGNQVSTFDPSPMLKAMQVPGVVCIDEIFSCEGDITNGLNSLLESGDRSIMTPAGKIEMHPECVVVGTANANGRSLDNMYTGVNVQDFSLLNRFVETKMSYSPEVEQKLLAELNDPVAESDLFSKVTHLRKKIRENNIFYDVSTRKLLQCMKLVRNGFSVKEAFEDCFLVSLSKAERLKVGL